MHASSTIDETGQSHSSIQFESVVQFELLSRVKSLPGVNFLLRKMKKMPLTTNLSLSNGRNVNSCPLLSLSSNSLTHKSKEHPSRLLALLSHFRQRNQTLNEFNGILTKQIKSFSSHCLQDTSIEIQ